MSWVPIADSGLPFELTSNPEIVTLVGSTATSVAALPADDSSFSIFIDGELPQIRVTVVDFQSNSESGVSFPASFSYGANQQVNEAVDFGNEFSPGQFELAPSEPAVTFQYSPTGGSEWNVSDNYQFLIEVWVDEPTPDAEYNCDCDCGYPTKTLAEMRNEVATAMGYAAQLAALPASFVHAANFQLNLAQRMAAQDIVEINAVRYFTWDVEAGQTKFCTTDNLETCRNQLAATRITEVYAVHDGGIITRLRKGIPFILHSAGGDAASIPSRYEVRSCIEIWPPPSSAMKIVAKGSLAAVNMVNDTDTPTVDPDLIVLRTIAFMKAAKQHPDANIYMGQYNSFIRGLNAEMFHDMDPIIPGWCCIRRRDRLTHVMDPLVYGDDP